MKAAQIDSYGDATAVQIRQIDKPSINDGQVLVEVHASSINPFDIAVRSGKMQQTIPLTLPITLGGDIAGVVAQVGSSVTHVAAGDKVYGQANVVAGNSGALAEFAATKGEQVAKAPGNLDFAQAASLPLVGVSAVQVIYDHLKLAAKQKIFITGGTGGIGSLAIQIAHHLGADVTATATGDDIELAKNLGAQQVIDYKNTDLSQLPRAFNAVFDTVGGETFTNAVKAVKPGGVAVSMIAEADKELVERLGITAITQATKITTQSLDKLRKLVEAKAVTPQVSKTYPLDQIIDAFQAKEKDRFPGKIVIAIR